VERFITTTEIGNEILSIVEGYFCMLLWQRLQEIVWNKSLVVKKSFTGAEITKSDGFDRPIIVSSIRKTDELNVKDRKSLLSIGYTFESAPLIIFSEASYKNFD